MKGNVFCDRHDQRYLGGNCFLNCCRSLVRRYVNTSGIWLQFFHCSFDTWEDWQTKVLSLFVWRYAADDFRTPCYRLLGI